MDIKKIRQVRAEARIVATEGRPDVAAFMILDLLAAIEEAKMLASAPMRKLGD